MTDRFQDIIDEYTASFSAHGDSPAALLGAKGRQNVRFQALVPLLRDGQVRSLLDYGCGLAHLLPFLRSVGWQGSYHGVDIVEPFIRHVQDRGLEGARFDHIQPDSRIDRRYDLVFASGVFNLQTHEDTARSKQYALDRIGELFAAADLFLVCDFMTAYVDFTQPGAQHWSPGELADYSVEHFTRRFIVRHDLLPYEFSFVFCKQSSIARPANVYTVATE